MPLVQTAFAVDGAGQNLKLLPAYSAEVALGNADLFATMDAWQYLNRMNWFILLNGLILSC